MFNIFSTQNPIGLHINDEFVRIAQINNKGNITLLNKIALPNGTIFNGKIMREGELILSIKNLFKEAGKENKISNREVICSLPEQLTYLKKMEVDEKNNEIQKTIESELSAHIPEEIDNLYIDWEIINPKKIKNKLNNQTLQILAGAGEKRIIEQYINVLEKAELSPIALEIESLAIARAVIKNNEKRDENNSTGILYIDSSSSMFILCANTVEFSIMLPFSGKKIINLLMESLKINEKQAIKAKTMCGLDEKKAKGAVKKILQPIVLDIIKQIKNIENYYLTYYKNKKINNLILCGEYANLSNLDKIINESAKIKTEIVLPTINLINNKNKNYFNNPDISSYTESIGLALNNFKTQKNGV